jgi:hypothetical protein
MTFFGLWSAPLAELIKMGERPTPLSFGEDALNRGATNPLDHIKSQPHHPHCWTLGHYPGILPEGFRIEFYFALGSQRMEPWLDA